MEFSDILKLRTEVLENACMHAEEWKTKILKTEIPSVNVKTLEELVGELLNRLNEFLTVEKGDLGKSKSKILNTQIPNTKIQKIENLFFFFLRPKIHLKYKTRLKSRF